MPKSRRIRARWLGFAIVGAFLILAANVRSSDARQWMLECLGWSLPIGVYTFARDSIAQSVLMTLGLLLLVLAVACRP